MCSLISYAEFEQKILSFNLTLDKPFVAAVSGGADSLCLVFLLFEFCKKHHTPLRTVTVDHALRPESKKEALWVHELLEKKGISHTILTWTHEDITSRIEEKARENRYRLCFDFCKSHGTQALFLGHHLEDNVETFLLRLKKGSGLKGLSAMKEKVKRENIFLLRPLLSFSKEQIVKTLAPYTPSWVEDPSNKDMRYERVFLRENKENIEKMGFSYTHISKSIFHLQKAEDYLEERLSKLLSNNVLLDEKGFARLPLSFFGSLLNEEKIGLLSLLIQKIGGNLFAPKRESIERFLDNGAKKTTLGKCILVSSKGFLYIGKEPSKVEKDILVEKEIPFLWDRFEGVVSKTLTLGRLRKAVVPDIPAVIQHSFPAFYDKNTLFFIPNLDYPENKCHLNYKLHLIKEYK
ncbi:MAG: tRNA lysidine(34) synthetase TilS [Alphaproteobacteria bacterium]|nr:tRNA lysidine(34) synthetase TilS [Alphaproteobacteria bacterium]